MGKARDQIVELEAQRQTTSDQELKRKFEQAEQRQQEAENRGEKAEARNKELEAQLQSEKTQSVKCLEEKDILIQDLQRQLAEQQEETKLSCRCSKRKYENILSKLYPHIGYLYFHDLSPFQATPCNGVEVSSHLYLS